MIDEESDFHSEFQSILASDHSSRLFEFRENILRDINTLPVTMDVGLSPYIYVDWLTTRGGIIWGHRFMIEVPYLYESIAPSLDFALQSAEVFVESLKEQYPFFRNTILLFDTGWVKRGDQAVLVTQTQLNFNREVFLQLKELSVKRPPTVVLFLLKDGRVKATPQGDTKSIPLTFNLLPQHWERIWQIKWIKDSDTVPKRSYSQLRWFFPMVETIKQAFISSNNLCHSVGLPYEAEFIGDNE
jgi:hypothetical protein